jgi:ribosomal protein S18 acetylase RimI-like enzyme
MACSDWLLKAVLGEEKRVEIRTVDSSNVDERGFFCYKSKPKSEGYKQKLAWLEGRFSEGMKIKIVYEGERSVGFIETIPAEYSWRVLDAPGYLAIHCLWVVGRAKGKGYGSLLLDACTEDARKRGMHGVVMVSSQDNWLANEKVFLKNRFERRGEAPPSFQLVVQDFGDGPSPRFPNDWEERLAAYGAGATVVFTDQCPYMPTVVNHAVGIFQERGIETKVVKLEDLKDVRERSPSAYGVFGIVFNGRLLTYHYVGPRELRRLDEELLS